MSKNNEQPQTTVKLTATWHKNIMSGEREEEELRIGTLYLGSIQRSAMDGDWLYYRKGDPGARPAPSREAAKDALVRTFGGEHVKRT